MPEFITATADIRGDYRYSLTRAWDLALPTITFVLLNPSTADDLQLDPTLTRCVNFAKRDGFGGMVILNLYAFRSRHPRVMKAAADPVGPENDRVLAGASGTVVAGWGNNAHPTRVARALKLLPRLHVLSITKEGNPGHPLYLPSDSPMTPWN